MDSPPVITFVCPVKTNSGNRALENLPVELAHLNAFKPLVVTSRETVGDKAIGILTRAFGDSGMTLGLFDQVGKAADGGVIEQLKVACLQRPYDAIIALGGGAVADTAKLLSLAVSQKVNDARLLSFETPIRGHLLPLVVVPTAQASGLETSQFARLGETVFSSEFLAPNLAVIDPRLVVAGDGHTIAVSGLAAFGRAIDAHTSPVKNPFRDAYSFAAIRFLKENLMNAVSNPRDPKACLAVANAVAMSGCAFSNADQKTLHTLGQAFEELASIPAGIIMGLCLPQVLNDWLKNGERDLAALLDPLTGEDAAAQMSPDNRAQVAVAALERFWADLVGTPRLKLPVTLKQAGVSGYVLEDILSRLSADTDGPYLQSVVKRIAAGPERKG